jgi:hypothetical protein
MPENTLLANQISEGIPLFLKLFIQTKKPVNYHRIDVPSNLSLTSMKCNKIVRQSFHFRESEKMIKEDSMEAFFLK